MATLQNLDDSLASAMTLVAQVSVAVAALQTSLNQAVAILATPPPPPIDYAAEVSNVTDIVGTLTSIQSQVTAMQSALNSVLPH